MGTWIAVIAATVALLGVAAVRSAHRRRRARAGSSGRNATRSADAARSAARSAARDLRRDSRRRRGLRSRGTGDHFGRTKINKYGDERHEDEAGAGFDGGSDGGGSD